MTQSKEKPKTKSPLVVRDLSLAIGGTPILKHVNVELPVNKITCIIGPSGCGKSTLLKTLNRLIDQNEDFSISGQVLLDGQDIIAASGSELIDLRRRIGLVPQQPTPLPMSIYDNVAYGCRIHRMCRVGRQMHARVLRYLRAVGLVDEVKGKIRTSASRLSIGQQQRLCLARSLAVEPEFILADEVTSALDPISSRTVEDLFVKLKQDYSIVMVTHTLSQAQRIADHVVFIYMGEVIETGSAEQVFSNPQHELTQKYLKGIFS